MDDFSLEWDDLDWNIYSLIENVSAVYTRTSLYEILDTSMLYGTVPAVTASSEAQDPCLYSFGSFKYFLQPLN